MGDYSSIPPQLTLFELDGGLSSASFDLWVFERGRWRFS